MEHPTNVGKKDHISVSEEEERHRKKDPGKKKESKKGNKDKGYVMFEEEDSEDELVTTDDIKSPKKMSKKHGKHSFMFQKKENKLKWKKKKTEPAGGKAVTEVSGVAVPVVSEVKPVFGVPLSMSVERSKCHDGILLPAVFRECVDYMEEYGLDCEGIYRVSGVKSKVMALKDAYNRRIPVYLAEHEPSIVASLLKQFLREIPEPVLTHKLMPAFEQASASKNVKKTVEEFQRLVDELPVYNKNLLSWTIIHMTHVIAKESKNKMSLQNVSIVLSPTMQISHRVLNVLFTHSKILFRDTNIKRYVPPLRPVTSRWSLELPESPTALEEELKKQESLLNQLHEELTRKKNAEKEEQLWEVQRVVTQLKRKIKQVKKAMAAHSAQDRKDTDVSKEKQARLHQQVQEKIQEKLAQAHQLQQNQQGSPKLNLTLKHKTESPKVSQEHLQTESKATSQKEVPKDEVDNEKKDSNETKVVAEKEEKERKESAEGVPEKSEKDEDVEENEQTKDAEPSSQESEKRNSLNQEQKNVEEVEPKKETEKVDKATSETIEQNKNSSQEVSNDTVDEDEESPVFDDVENGMTDSLKVQDQSETDDVPTETDQMSSEEEEMDEEMYAALLEEHVALLLEEEELMADGDELRQKIDTEQNEIERLHQEIAELTAIREDLYESGSSDSSSDESEGEDELIEILKNFSKENAQLERDTADLCEKIHQERQICIDVKVQIRMIQQKQQAANAATLATTNTKETD